MVKNPLSNAGGECSIPGWGTEIPYAAGKLSLSATAGESLSPTRKTRRNQSKIKTNGQVQFPPKLFRALLLGTRIFSIKVSKLLKKNFFNFVLGYTY